MTKTTIYNQIGDKISEADLNPGIFGIEKIDPSLVHAAVRTQRHNARGPWAHTKMMGEVAGSGKKPWKQKGTGRARVGSVRSPLWRHGGITFGPRNDRDWTLKMNRSAFRKALFTILTDKLNAKKLVVIDKFDQVAKTKDLVKKIDDLSQKTGLGPNRALVVADLNKELSRAGRNLKNIAVLSARRLNVLDLLKHDLIITEDALKVIEQTYLK